MDVIRSGSGSGSGSEAGVASGVISLWRGNLPNVAKAAPQKALDFFTYDLFKKVIAKTPINRDRNKNDDPNGSNSDAMTNNASSAVQFLSGGLAGVSSCV